MTRWAFRHDTLSSRKLHECLGDVLRSAQGLAVADWPRAGAPTGMATSIALEDRPVKVDVILEAGLPESAVAALAVQAERHGIQTLWVSSFPSRRDPVPALVLAARETRRIRLGTLPMSPYEVHPLRIADQLLTLNELSQGRATILIGGLGHSVGRVTGLQPTRRVTAVRETVSILKGLRPEAQLDFKGELYSLMNYRAEWATQPAPRIYAGATFEKMGAWPLRWPMARCSRTRRWDAWTK